jgi:hypothetical protein
LNPSTTKAQRLIALVDPNSTQIQHAQLFWVGTGHKIVRSCSNTNTSMAWAVLKIARTCHGLLVHHVEVYGLAPAISPHFGAKCAAKWDQ